MGDLVIVSRHEKGFWQADFYRDGQEIPSDQWETIGPSPDGFFTMKRDGSALDAFTKAQGRWPGALVIYSNTDRQ